jgi:hypothetical protein
MKEEQEEPKKNKVAEQLGALISLAVAVYMVYLGLTMMF